MVERPTAVIALAGPTLCLAGQPAASQTTPVTAQTSSATAKAAATPPAPPRKATAEERAQAERLDPLARADQLSLGAAQRAGQRRLDQLLAEAGSDLPMG